MKGPAVFLAQFLRDESPFNDVETLAPWMREKGFTGVQLPAWDSRAIDVDAAAESPEYCARFREQLAEHDVELTELAAYLAGQVLVMHPMYEGLFQGFFPAGLSGSSRSDWAAREIEKTIQASANLGTKVVPVLSGGLAWHMLYPWPPRVTGIVDDAFAELARLWRPLLDFAADRGVVLAYELHPGSDIFDGATFERFLSAVGDHPAACLNYDPSHLLLQQLDYVEFIYLYGERIHGFHVKDAEFRPSGRVGVYGGFEPWAGRAGRFRSLGDGQVDFGAVFTALAEVGYDGWAVLEWECCVKSAAQGATEGAPFIERHIIDTASDAFDDFAAGNQDPSRNRMLLGLEPISESGGMS
jgi:sugar phosphate isomerase/epimerase